MAAISLRRDQVTRSAGYLVGYKPTRRVRGWPVESAKPFQLYQRFESESGKVSWHHVASFRTAALLESNFRARAGC